MAHSMKKAAKLVDVFSAEESDLFLFAYKNVIASRLSSWRSVSSTVQKSAGYEKKWSKKFQKEVEHELFDLCHEGLNFADKFFNPKAGNPESKVFYLKTKDDFYRDLAEVATGEYRSGVVENSKQSYQEAFGIAKRVLPLFLSHNLSLRIVCRHKMQPTDPFRLELVLCYTKFLYYVYDEPVMAQEIAQEEYDETSEQQEEIASSMEVLGKNLTKWTSQWAVKQGAGTAGTSGGK
ncbi:14-3-3 protein [Aphelenchoides fujianensis]|nr:14-3-3 protein [Aphelenchoides fujianensis]